MRITIIILLIGICLVSAKYLPYESSDTNVLLRSRRSNSDESVPSTDRDDSSDNEEEEEDNDSSESESENKRQEKEEKQRQKLLERQEKARRKEEEAQRKLEEKQAKQQRKEEEKREKEERKRLERMEKEIRKEEERKKKILEKEERKKQEEQRKQIEKLHKETLEGKPTYDDGLLDTEEDDSIELGDIWRNHIYVKYGLTLLSTRAEKQAALNKYMQEELGLNSNSTVAERRQAIVKLIQTKLQNDTASRDALQNQLINHINAVSLHKLRTDLDINIEKISNKSEILNNVTLPWAAVAQENLKEQRSFLQTISQFLSNILPNWATAGLNQSGNSSNNSNNELSSGNDFEGSSTLSGDASSPIPVNLESNTGLSLSSSINVESPSAVNSNVALSSSDNEAIDISDNTANVANNDTTVPTEVDHLVSSGDNDVTLDSNVVIGSGSDPSLSNNSLTSGSSDAAVSDNDNVGSTNNYNTFSMEGSKGISSGSAVNTSINDETANASSSSVTFVSEQGNKDTNSISAFNSNINKESSNAQSPNVTSVTVDSNNDVQTNDLVSQYSGTVLNVNSENNLSSNAYSPPSGGIDDVINNQGNALSMTPTLSVESSGSTDDIIDKTLNISTNTEIIPAGSDATTSNNEENVDSANVPLPNTNAPGFEGSDNIISNDGYIESTGSSLTGSTGSSNIVSNNISSIEPDSSSPTNIGPVTAEEIFISNDVNIESSNLPSTNNNNIPTEESSIDNAGSNIGTLSPTFLSTDFVAIGNDVVLSSNINIESTPNPQSTGVPFKNSVSVSSDGIAAVSSILDVQTENNPVKMNTEVLPESADSANNSVGSTTSNEKSNTVTTIEDNKNETSSSANSVSAVVGGIGDFVTASDTDSSLTDNILSTGAAEPSTSNLNTPIAVDVEQISKNDNSFVSTEASPVLSNISLVIVNAADVNVSSANSSIDNDETTASNLGAGTLESTVLETVNNEPVSVSETVTLNTEAIDTDLAQSSAIDQIAVSGLDSSTQLNSETVVTGADFPTTAVNEVISNVNTASNNAATEPSLEGSLKPSEQSPQLINPEVPGELSAPIENTDGITIPAESGATVVEISEQL